MIRSPTIFERADARLLPGFERRRVSVDGRAVQAVLGGSGPPLLMLHGDPQTHLCWHAIAPTLRKHFTVVLSDLRGRGESNKPAASTTIERNAYSKRSMASEQRGLMRALGYDRFSLVGHDRGARVARRLALDHPEAVDALVVMDVVPALDFYERADATVAQDYVPAIWRRWSDDLQVMPMPCGHFIPEEVPIEALAAVRDFLDRRHL